MSLDHHSNAKLDYFRAQSKAARLTVVQCMLNRSIFPVSGVSLTMVSLYEAIVQPCSLHSRVSSKTTHGGLRNKRIEIANRVMEELCAGGDEWSTREVHTVV
jgi:hypothetical protein